MRKSLAGAALAGLIVAAVRPATAATAGEATAATVRSSLLAELSDYLKDYRATEHISAVSLAVTFRGSGRGIYLAAGSTRFSGGSRISPHALWQIGSNTKAFTSVLVLELEAGHRLSINDMLGRWLPQYAAWRHVTVRQLLDMTSGIPSYTDSATFWQDVAAPPHGVFLVEIDAAGRAAREHDRATSGAFAALLAQQHAGVRVHHRGKGNGHETSRPS